MLPCLDIPRGAPPRLRIEDLRAIGSSLSPRTPGRTMVMAMGFLCHVVACCYCGGGGGCWLFWLRLVGWLFFCQSSEKWVEKWFV